MATLTKASEVKAGDTIHNMIHRDGGDLSWTVIAVGKTNNRRLPIAITFKTDLGHEITLDYGYTRCFWAN